MTRAAVYITGLCAFAAATSMTFLSIYLPKWLTWTATSPTGVSIHKTIGLHQTCSSVTGECHHFPQYDDCHGSDRYFCSMWRTASFLVSFAAVLDLVTVVAFAVVILGGRHKREAGWKVLSGLLALVAGVQCAAMAIVAYLFDNDDRFFVGWKLDTGFILCTVSWSIAALSAALITLSAFVFPSEGGYELIPSERLNDGEAR